jgi:hypothetical protein
MCIKLLQILRIQEQCHDRDGFLSEITLPLNSAQAVRKFI